MKKLQFLMILIVSLIVPMQQIFAAETSPITTTVATSEVAKSVERIESPANLVDSVSNILQNMVAIINTTIMSAVIEIKSLANKPSAQTASESVLPNVQEIMPSRDNIKIQKWQDSADCAMFGICSK